jgi:hypothetical protein
MKINYFKYVKCFFSHLFTNSENGPGRGWEVCGIEKVDSVVLLYELLLFAAQASHWVNVLNCK